MLPFDAGSVDATETFLVGDIDSFDMTETLLVCNVDCVDLAGVPGLAVCDTNSVNVIGTPLVCDAGVPGMADTVLFTVLSPVVLGFPDGLSFVVVAGGVLTVDVTLFPPPLFVVEGCTIAVLVFTEGTVVAVWLLPEP